jgi:hypothetical protein
MLGLNPDLLANGLEFVQVSEFKFLPLVLQREFHDAVLLFVVEGPKLVHLLCPTLRETFGMVEEREKEGTFCLCCR